MKPLDLIALRFGSNSFGICKLWMCGVSYPRDYMVSSPDSPHVHLAVLADSAFDPWVERDLPLTWIENPARFCDEFNLSDEWVDALQESRRIRKVKGNMVPPENGWLYW